jgi:hypothetical protein
LEVTVDTTRVPQPHDDHEQERPCACYEGVVFVGHLVEEAGDEVEIVEAASCRRCAR